MKNLVLTSSDVTPYVNFDYTSGHLELSGRSLPEDSYKFYTPILEWLNEYLKELPQKTVLEFKMEYFNTSSTYFILNLIKEVGRLKHFGSEVLIKWYYDPGDDDMRDAGKDLGKLGNFPIELVAC